MFRTLSRLIRFCFYALVILLGVAFAVSNRGKIELTFYPLPYALEIPIYLFGIILFALGLLLGWIITGTGGLKSRLAQRSAVKRQAALENELSALRTEQFIRPAALPPQ